ncbi:MAG: RING-HC finger protein [Promethearchaeota archaeon]
MSLRADRNKVMRGRKRKRKKGGGGRIRIGRKRKKKKTLPKEEDAVDQMQQYGSFLTISNQELHTNNSFITGNSNTIHGNNNVICGNNNTLRGDGNELCGNNNEVFGNSNDITGSHTEIKGDNNTITGTNNEAEGEGNTIHRTTSAGQHHTIVLRGADGGVANIVSNSTVSGGAFQSLTIGGGGRLTTHNEPFQIPKELKKEEEDAPEGTQTKELCKICLARKFCTFVIDCGHACMCTTCSRRICLSKITRERRCPICRKTIYKGVRLLYT